MSSIANLSEKEVSDYAEALKTVLVKYDNLVENAVSVCDAAASTRRLTAAITTRFHFHIEFHPPLRKPNLLKYLAGPEIGGGNFLSDTSPEEKAAELQAQSAIHYKQE